MPFLFTPPSIQVGTRGPIELGRGLFMRMSIAQGQTLLKKDGFYTLESEPSSTEIDAADIVYLGGYTYTVSDAEAADLRAAGYSDGLSNLPINPVVGGYGVGRFGVGNYGSGDTDPLSSGGYGTGPYGVGEFGE